MDLVRDMNKTIKVAISVGVITLAAITVWGGMGLTSHLIVAIDRWGASAPDLKPTIDAISGPRGTIHEVNKAIVKIGDAVVTTQIQERKTQPYIVATMDEFSQTAKHLSGTANAATGTLNAATETLGEGKRTIADAQPLLIQLTANGASLQRTTDTLNDTLKRKAVGEMLDNLAGITGHTNALMDDGQRVGDDLTRRYFTPSPWYYKLGPFVELGAKVGNKALGIW